MPPGFPNRPALGFLTSKLRQRAAARAVEHLAVEALDVDPLGIAPRLVFTSSAARLVSHVRRDGHDAALPRATWRSRRPVVARTARSPSASHAASGALPHRVGGRTWRPPSRPSRQVVPRIPAVAQPVDVPAGDLRTVQMVTMALSGTGAPPRFVTGVSVEMGDAGLRPRCASARSLGPRVVPPRRTAAITIRAPGPVLEPRSGTGSAGFASVFMLLPARPVVDRRHRDV